MKPPRIQVPAADPDDPTPEERLAVLLELFDLERVEQDIFRGRNLDVGSWKRLYGGQVAAQALIAASRTVPLDRPVHSLHSYFIRPGDPDVPVVYLVDRIRDGRSFTTRRVVAVQNGQAIYALTSSHQVPAPGLEHGMTMPPVPSPGDVGAEPPMMRGQGEGRALGQRLLSAVDVRYVSEDEAGDSGVPGELSATSAATSGGESPLEYSVADEVPVHAWLRASSALPDDPATHTAFAVFVSDLGVLESAFARHRVFERGQRFNIASLDHAMWFHRQFRADEWFLYSRSSPSASGSRALGFAQMFTADGEHAVTVMQEAMVRPLRG